MPHTRLRDDEEGVKGPANAALLHCVHLNWPLAPRRGGGDAGEQRYVLSQCCATVGTVGNTLHVNRVLGKAGASRHLGIRPTTRAIATNPRDHPMGGKAKKQRKTPWGKVFMGVRTRNKLKRGAELIQLSRHQARAAARR
jgi:Ribosomal Proteins L2, C-terminal domain